MTTYRKLMMACAAGALLIAAGPALAEDAHHPPGAAQPAPAQTTAPAPAPQPPAAAQASDVQPGTMGGGVMGMMGGGSMGMMGHMMAPGRIEGRIAFLKTELKITDAQQPLWNAFTEALRVNARGMSGMMGDMQDMMMMGAQGPAALPQRLELHERMLAARLDALRRLKGALGPLYAAFDDAQKRTADQLLMPGPMGAM
ncbi:Spy/CpxP family protein refolding chaperone [Ancylobacter sp. IITR112]|uniref:Spy/CpxP family protein refolding chaperone n=1 Tax=Ancylobacter sp. IITR112 TaxID=3138073 RepID=UPI00352B9142